LSQIPESITKLTNLTQLDLSGNNLTQIPESITKLSNLIIFDLEGNEIEKPPLEIVNQGIKSIRNYFWQLKAGEDNIYEAKFIIVGEGGAGQTTLANKIINPNYDLNLEEPSTEGIDVIQWKFKLDNDREFTVNIWDFGGQEIYHSTHQFFLTKRSLYAIVIDTRKEDHNLYYWMNVVELLSDNSPILIIKNEKQNRHREIDEAGLRGEFTSLKETLATNLKSNKNLEEILFNIKQYIQKLPHVGNALPKTWVDVRQALEKLKSQNNNYISLDKYLNICKNNGFSTYKNALQLSQYLHDLGVCLHFQDDPALKNFVILKPEWGTDAVYKVLDNNRVIRKLGCFSKRDLANIWNETKYQRMHSELLQLMINFKLCYQIPNNKDKYLAPQLLSLKRPDYNWNSEKNVRIRYEYGFMPKGILTRFIVEMHKNIDQDNVWRNGVILTDNYAKAEIIENYDKKEIRIRISGNQKREFLAIILNEIDKINNSYEKIKYNKLIDCNCSTCKNSSQPHFYRLQELKERTAYQQEYIGCGKPPFHQVKVLELIDETIGKQNTSDNNETSDNNIIFHIDKVETFGLEQGKKTMGDRKININNGNYNEKIEGDYIQGDKIDNRQIDNSDRSKELNIGNIGGDFNPVNSPMMSENAGIKVNQEPQAPAKTLDKKWIIGIIISIIAIISSASFSGLFNDQAQEFLERFFPSKTQQQIEE
ncbi:small G protein, GTPase SAR1, partial [Xenococcus sp. PCC 7305]|uniref:COR domain-containing protein n=1 Tax=Xenococcus sp. PCC 7305 TaxID=102125 RepID=UPI0002AC2080